MGRERKGVIPRSSFDTIEKFSHPPPSLGLCQRKIIVNFILLFA
jgi:hypothetical protein